MSDINQKVDKSELDKIRGLEDFDLTMLISEIHDHGWPLARILLCQMPPEDEERRKKMQEKARPHYEALKARGIK